MWLDEITGSCSLSSDARVCPWALQGMAVISCSHYSSPCMASSSKSSAGGHPANMSLQLLSYLL